ncbi:MAG: pyridoxamine 5'-phosphate oxidase family protein [Candidatus Latescibacterota bacterium]
MAKINSVDQLRSIYRKPRELAANKVLTEFEEHSRRFVKLSPFLVISTIGADGIGDVSPRGDAPGFVKVMDDNRTIAIPDRRGNNRIDTLSNIITNPSVGTIFFIPGIAEVMRVNGTATVDDDADLRTAFEVKGKRPSTVILIEAREIFLHCAKAIMRSGLWRQENQVGRTIMPTIAQMISDQIGRDRPMQTQREVEKAYQKELY